MRAGMETLLGQRHLGCRATGHLGPDRGRAPGAPPFGLGAVLHQLGGGPARPHQPSDARNTVGRRRTGVHTSCAPERVLGRPSRPHSSEVRSAGASENSAVATGAPASAQGSVRNVPLPRTVRR